MRKWFALFFVFFACHVFAGAAVDKRRQLPAALNHSWIGLTAGLKSTNFSNADLAEGFRFGKIHDEIAALRLSIGHYFNPYVGLAASLMRGVHSNKFHNGTQNGESVGDTVFSVSESTFGITLLPTLPLGRYFSLYGEIGPAFISRHGFAIHSLQVVKDSDILTGLFGGGITLALPYHMAINVNSIYTLAVKPDKQPGVWYLGLGLNYSLMDDNFVKPGRNTYGFALNYLQLAYTNQNWFYFDIAKYLTTPQSIPIFFDGSIKIGRGVQMIYERNFFHTDKHFSLEWGVSVAHWRTRYHPQSFYTLSIFPEMKVWMVRSLNFDLYFSYSLAGPSYISRRFFNGEDSGSKFTFQDFIGLGAFLGKSKRANLNLKIVHYSNGNSLPANPGVDVPVMLGFGLTW